MTDGDGEVEVNGRILKFEWKSQKEVPPMGQDIMFRAFSKNSPKQSVIVVYGKASTVEPRYFMEYIGGEATEWKPIDFEGLKEYFRNWDQRSVKGLNAEPTPSVMQERDYSGYGCD